MGPPGPPADSTVVGDKDHVGPEARRAPLFPNRAPITAPLGIFVVVADKFSCCVVERLGPIGALQRNDGRSRVIRISWRRPRLTPRH